MNKTAEAILDRAEEAIRTGGYGSFSFREIAGQIGIKSASVHYHFPTKAHLGVAVASRYRNRFAQALDDIDEAHSEASDRLAAYIGIYRLEMQQGSNRMSICMMLAAEKESLPEEIQSCVTAFYRMNLEWLARVLTATGQSPDLAARRARQILALLQGALLGAKTLADEHYFEAAVEAIQTLGD